MIAEEALYDGHPVAHAVAYYAEQRRERHARIYQQRPTRHKLRWAV